MSCKFKPCMDILPTAQRRLWPELKAAAELGFVLYGGTAIAVRLGHRASVDFDFFSEEPLDRDAIKAAFSFVEQSTTRKDERNTWVLDLPDSGGSHVQITSFCPSPAPRNCGHKFSPPPR